MKLIYIYGGLVARVSDEDYETLSGFRWHMNSGGYAQRNLKLETGGHVCITMHQCVMAAPSGMQVDHKDGDKLNNTRENLRVCSPSQNQRNRKGLRGRKLKGVYPNGAGWQALVRGLGEPIYVGTFSTQEAAARAYDRAAHEIEPEFAHLNFDDGIWTAEQLDKFRLKKPVPVSGFTGVSKNGNGWAARLKSGKKFIHIGQFKTQEDAAKARESYIANMQKITP